MQSRTASPAAVKQSDDDSPEKFPQVIPDIESENLCRRFDGYLKGWFRNNVPCVLAAEFKRRFKKRTGYSWKHIDDVFPTFQRWSTNFRFQRQRLGRSTCVVITLRYRPMVLTTAEVRRRLVGAIRNHVAKSGCAHVDRKFLENFHRLTGVSPEQIFYAWRTLRRIDGHRCRWRGRGNGVNFYVQAGVISHPEIASGISPPTGGKDMKTSAALPPGLQGRSSSSLRSHQSSYSKDRLPGYARPKRIDRAKPPQNDHACHRWKPVLEPLHVCNRWVSAARILRKANFLAFGPMQNLHSAFFRVRFGPMHARNFAEAALRMGFLDSEICAAYRVGLEETQASAARDWHDFGGGDGMREPSQAVARGWLRLRADERTDEARWAAIFRGEVSPELGSPAARAESAAARSPEPRGEFRAIAPGVRVRIPTPEPARLPTPDDYSAKIRAAARLPDPAPGLLRASMKEPKTFEKYLASRNFTIADVLKLPRAKQQEFVRAMHAWQKTSAEEFQK